MEIDLTNISISSALAGLHKREISAIQLTEACLRQVEKHNPAINAFITITPDLAVQAALQADAILAQHPSNLQDIHLLGIPLAIKDLFETNGVRTTAGSRFFTDFIPAQDAQAILLLKLNGAVMIGKTNTHEIALGVTGVNPHFGAVKNPWDTNRVTGGSSSGSAAAVATGMSLAGLGTDTGGSVRIPASLCGVVGLKPTHGRISTCGVIPLSWNLDHVGVLCRTTRDAAIILQVLAGYDPHDPQCMDTPVDDYLSELEGLNKDWRVAMAAGEYIESSDPEVIRAFAESGRVIKDLGAHVEKVDACWLGELAVANGRMTQADGAAFHRERLAAHPDWFGEDVRQRLEAGAALTSSDYALARRTQAEGRRKFEQFFTKYDLLILPTTPIPAPPIQGMGAIEAARCLTRFTAPFNLCGLPALSIPNGFNQDGLPLGLQIVSRHWGERQLLQAGHAVEQATPWHLSSPKLQDTQ